MRKSVPPVNGFSNCLIYYLGSIHWRHCNPGHRAMGRVVFLPRPEIIYINTPFSLPRPEVIYIWAWLISAPNGVSDYLCSVFVKVRLTHQLKLCMILVCTKKNNSA